MTRNDVSGPGAPEEPGIEEPGGGTATMLEVVEETTPRTAHGDGDHDRFAH